MTINIRFIFGALAALVLYSCVNSGMYNSSIGQNSKVVYKEKSSSTSSSNPTSTVTTSNGASTVTEGNGYRIIDLSEDTQDETPIVESNSNTSLEDTTVQIVEKQVVDTVVTYDTKIVSYPIDEKQKDSLLFALVKDKTLTQEQKDKKMRDFVRSHQKEVKVADTSFVTKTVYDTIISVTPVEGGATTTNGEGEQQNSELSQTERDLQNKVKELEEKLKRLEEAETRQEKKEAKKEVKLSAQELYQMGKRDGKRNYDGTRDFTVPLSGFSTLSFISIAPYYFAAFFLIGVLGAFFISLIRMFIPPKVNWNSLSSKYKAEMEYRRGYQESAWNKRVLNSLIIFIPAALILGVLVLLLI